MQHASSMQRMKKAVDAFLKEKIHFMDIPSINTHVMERISLKKAQNLDDFVESDKLARIEALNYINKL